MCGSMPYRRSGFEISNGGGGGQNISKHQPSTLGMGVGDVCFAGYMNANDIEA